MMIRMTGVVLLISGCGSFGFLMGIHYHREIQMLRILLSTLQEMEWELRYRLTPLPDLCTIAADTAKGKLRELFCELGYQLESGTCAEVSGCMNGLVQKKDIPYRCGRCLKDLGRCLGRYDLEGQLQGLASVKAQIRAYLEELDTNRAERIRSYQTLALCAGCALAILLV